MSDQNSQPSGAHQLFGHPRGLSVLFLTETAAYFSAYGMQALLVLYMIQSLGLPQAHASAIYGIYVGGANLSPILGGWLADRYLGQHRSVILGAALMTAGHLSMFWSEALYIGLTLVACGNGFFITSLVSRIGSLYAAGDARRDRAYLIYYIGINLGSFLAPLVCGWLAQTYGWHVGLGAAAAVMAAGLVFYLACSPMLPRDAQMTRSPHKPVSKPARRSTWRLLLPVLGVVVCFRLGYEQMGNTVSLWIDGSVDRAVGATTLPTPWFQSLNPFFIFATSPLLAMYWRRRETNASAIAPQAKMAIGGAFAILAFAVLMLSAMLGENKVHIGYAVAYFFLMTLAEIHIIPVGLSVVASLSNDDRRSTMVGIWYFIKFLAGMGAGLIGTLWSSLSPATFFAINLIIALATFLLMLSIAINRNRAEAVN